MSLTHQHFQHRQRSGPQPRRTRPPVHAVREEPQRRGRAAQHQRLPAEGVVRLRDQRRPVAVHHDVDPAALGEVLGEGRLEAMGPLVGLSAFRMSMPSSSCSWATTRPDRCVAPAARSSYASATCWACQEPNPAAASIRAARAKENRPRRNVRGAAGSGCAPALGAPGPGQFSPARARIAGCVTGLGSAGERLEAPVLRRNAACCEENDQRGCRTGSNARTSLSCADGSADIPRSPRRADKRQRRPAVAPLGGSGEPALGVWVRLAAVGGMRAGTAG
ncbi:hypothetical protein SCYAM73S_01108 [Streptomyces cyaneofuscatus]